MAFLLTSGIRGHLIWGASLTTKVSGIESRVDKLGDQAPEIAGSTGWRASSTPRLDGLTELLQAARPARARRRPRRWATPEF